MKSKMPFIVVSILLVISLAFNIALFSRIQKDKYLTTSMGHIASQKVAIGSGFVPAWAELVTDRLE